MTLLARFGGRFLPAVLDHELGGLVGGSALRLAPRAPAPDPPPDAGPTPGVQHDERLPDPAVVPACLRERRQWVCWRYEQRNGKQTKVPVDPHSGAMASPTDPTMWGTFEHAIAACAGAPGLAGVGFVFAADDPFAGVDLDDCRDPKSGELRPWAQKVVNFLDSYTEASPSGTGVKVFLRGTKPGKRCRKAHEGGEIEVYDRGRYFAVTGRHVPGTPTDVEARQHQLDRLHRRLFTPEPAKPPQPPPSTPQQVPPPVPPEARNGKLPDLLDADILRIASRSKSKAKFSTLWAGQTEAFASASEADAALCAILAFYTKDVIQIDRLFRASGLMRAKWDEQRGGQTYGEMTIANALKTVIKRYRPRGKRQRTSRMPPASADASATAEPWRPEIVIDTDEHRVVTETIAAMTADPDIYQRGGALVRVLRTGFPNDAIHRPDGSATISALPAANLRERLTRLANFKRYGRKGETVRAHPPGWLINAIECRGEWPGIRHLVSVSDAPVLRPDGTMWQQAGYDPVTGVLYQPAAAFPPIAEDLGREDARAAADELREVVCDFRFECEEHRSAWLAGLLTPLARFAFSGPAPLFLIDANVRGAGKGLLAQCIGQIVLGREMPVSSYAHDSDEMRKRITSLAIAGDRMILLDNLEGMFGNDALDRALTSTRWKDRILGRSEDVELPLIAIWCATGNNVQVAADTARRLIHVRLDVLDENPESRTGFKHPNLLAWIAENRPRLLTRGLTLLAAYCRAGRPSQNLVPLGSFEGWSSVVREAIVWTGLPDPCLTRARLAAAADTTADALAQLITALEACFGPENGFVLSELITWLYPPQRDQAPQDEVAVLLRGALENLVGTPPGKAPTAKQIGNRLRHFRRRVISGRYLDTDPARSGRGMVWRIHAA